MRLLFTALTIGSALMAAALPLRAEMTAPEREAFGAEVRAYLLANPEILSEMIVLLDERQRAAARAGDSRVIADHATAIFDDGFSFVGGNPEGDLTIVEFLDYQCGYCRKAHPEVVELLASDGNIRWIVKELPVLGPASEMAARAAIATLIADGPERYAVLNDILLRLDGPITETSLDSALAEAGADPALIRAGMDAPEVSRRIDATRTLAASLGIQGTPSFVFEDQMLRGYVPIAAMRDLVDDIRTVN